MTGSKPHTCGPMHRAPSAMERGSHQSANGSNCNGFQASGGSCWVWVNGEQGIMTQELLPNDKMKHCQLGLSEYSVKAFAQNW